MISRWQHRSGFTLVELLVSITIIMVLTVTAVVNYGNAQKNARDAKRKADLEKIRVALELCKQDLGGTYPVNYKNSLVDYLDTVPTADPLILPYLYSLDSATKYRLGAHVELDRNKAGTPLSVNCHASFGEDVPPGGCNSKYLNERGEIEFNYIIHSP